MRDRCYTMNDQSNVNLCDHDIHRSRYDFVLSLEHIVLANRVPNAYCIQGLSVRSATVEHGTHQSLMYQQMRSSTLMERCGLQLSDEHDLSTQARGTHSA